MAQVLGALRQLGVAIPSEADSLPFDLDGTGRVPGGVVTLDASASSQFVSALLLAGARYEAGVDVRHDGKPMPSLPHVAMTVSMLRDRGVYVDDAEPNRWVVSPGDVTGLDVEVEPDLSNATPFLAAAVATGGSVRVASWPRRTTQAGDRLREILTAFGARVELDDRALTVTGGDSVHGVDLDLHDVGELTPVVAALCALAASPSHLRGIGHIRGHETDRLAALAKELGGLGAAVTERPDGLSFEPATLTGGLWHTYADHRMAHAGVVVGAVVDDVLVENVATTGKTFPDFADVWSALL
jgi:3-phosphoshikimate 1-carboxyvinyltransferase